MEFMLEDINFDMANSGMTTKIGTWIHHVQLNATKIKDIVNNYHQASQEGASLSTFFHTQIN